MKELRERFFERLNNFKENSLGAGKELVNYRYGELYGLLESMITLNLISYDEYCHLINELDCIYDKIYNL